MGFPQRILVAVDFTEISDHALDAAADLARKAHASLCVMAAVDPHGSETLRGALQHLARLAAHAEHTDQPGGADLAVDTLVAAGDPREAIVSAARGTHADLIVVGTHVRGSIPPAGGRGASGSVAEAVVRTSDVPVMVVRGVVPRS